MYAYILLHVLLTGINSTLAQLEAHLGGGIGHEASKRRVHVAVSLSALALALRRTLLCAIAVCGSALLAVLR